MAGEWIDIGHEGLGGWLALPTRVPAPGILLLPDMQATERFVRSEAERYAEAGHVVLAPDLCWRLRPSAVGKSAGGKSAGGRSAGGRPAGYHAAVRRFDLQRGLQDLAVALCCLRLRTECTGLAGVLGFRFGARLALLGVQAVDIDAAVAVDPGEADAPAIEPGTRCPVALHMAGEACGEAAEAAGGRWRVYRYPGTRPGFAIPHRARFDAAAAALAHERSLAWFAARLGGPAERRGTVIAFPSGLREASRS
jgi:carboxymethylenebutenolidase